MEKIPDDLVLCIFGFMDFGGARGRNIISTQRVCCRFRELIVSHMKFEVDVGLWFRSEELMRCYHRLCIQWKQKRDSCLEWDDHRGFLVVTDFDQEKWSYYDRLLKTYTFDQRPVKFPHYHGRMVFYEYPN